MMPPRLQLDFERPAGPARWPGLLVLAAGMIVAVAAILDYRTVAADVSVLQFRQDSLEPSEPAANPAVQRGFEDANAAVHVLATPWPLLLQDLQQASEQSKGEVALLAIEPDRSQGRVRVLAEARTLPAALLYVYRLQGGQVLRNALLEKHEVQTKEKERPVRFQLTAAWAESP